jgi:hypothetical protein
VGPEHSDEAALHFAPDDADPAVDLTVARTIRAWYGKQPSYDRGRIDREGARGIPAQGPDYSTLTKTSTFAGKKSISTLSNADYETHPQERSRSAEVRFDRLGAEEQLDRKHKRNLHACRNSVAGRSRRPIRP